MHQKAYAHLLLLTSYIQHLTSYILHLTSYFLHLTSYILHLYFLTKKSFGPVV